MRWTSEYYKSSFRALNSQNITYPRAEMKIPEAFTKSIRNKIEGQHGINNLLLSSLHRRSAHVSRVVQTPTIRALLGCCRFYPRALWPCRSLGNVLFFLSTIQNVPHHSLRETRIPEPSCVSGNFDGIIDCIKSRPMNLVPETGCIVIHALKRLNAIFLCCTAH